MRFACPNDLGIHNASLVYGVDHDIVDAIAAQSIRQVMCLVVVIEVYVIYSVEIRVPDCASEGKLNDVLSLSGSNDLLVGHAEN